LPATTAWDAVTFADSLRHDSLIIETTPGRRTATIGYRVALRSPFYKTIKDLLIRGHVIADIGRLARRGITRHNRPSVAHLLPSGARHLGKTINRETFILVVLVAAAD